MKIVHKFFSFSLTCLVSKLTRRQMSTGLDGMVPVLGVPQFKGSIFEGIAVVASILVAWRVYQERWVMDEKERSGAPPKGGLFWGK